MRILSALVILTLSGFISCDKHLGQHANKLESNDRIFDYAHLLTTQQEDSLFQLIQSLDKEIGSQIAIVTVVSLNGQSIEEFSLEMAERLALGRAKFDDGVLITVAETDRMIRIEVGYGLERIIKDEIATRINREEIAPSFRENDYARGLTKGVRKIINLISDRKELVGQRP